MHVLAADDNEINRQFLRAIFEARGDQVSEADNGVAAITACRNHEFDLVLMDIRMPEVDGVEATARIVDEHDKPPVIVALTADMNAQEQEQLLKRGFAACLTKPISKDELLGAVMRCMRGGEPRREHRTLGPSHSDAPLDREAALAAAAGSSELVAKLTGMLTRELTSFGPQIAQFLDRNDYAGARELVHKLRASTGYCGAAPLQHAAAELEAALKQSDGAQITLIHEIFEQERIRLLEFIDSSG